MTFVPERLACSIDISFDKTIVIVSELYNNPGRTFSNNSYKVFAKQAFKEGDEKIAVQICSDDETAKETVKQLIEDMGFAPQDLGDFSQGVLFEPDAPLYNQNLKLSEAEKLLSQVRERCDPAS